MTQQESRWAQDPLFRTWAAPVSKKRIGLNRAPEPAMGIVSRRPLIGTAASWSDGLAQVRDPMTRGGAWMRWRPTDRARDAVFQTSEPGNDKERCARHKRAAAMAGVAFQD